MLKFIIFLGKLFLVLTFMFLSLTLYIVGFIQGYRNGIASFQKSFSDKILSTSKPVPTSTPIRYYVSTKPTWGGPQLWEVVNKRRVELGVNPLIVRDELCTIASIRLNELLDIGKLDGHAGFSNLPNTRTDLMWIFEKYNLSEFLVSGASTPQEAVSLWENTLGHKELLSGGQYVWGCIYAQNGFGVAIAAY